MQQEDCNWEGSSDIHDQKVVFHQWESLGKMLKELYIIFLSDQALLEWSNHKVIIFFITEGVIFLLFVSDYL